jgi:CarboxypepD_reg-like domain/TonB-dependent Receptor Plug Domain
MSTNFINLTTIRKNSIWILLFFNSISIFAHQSDLSTVLISQDEKGKCFLQIYSSLTAFEGEIDYKYSKNAYKTPEEFRALVMDHFKKNVLFICNEKDTVKFGKPIVMLGHETKLVVEIFSFPENSRSMYFKNTMFMNTPHNQSSLMMVKKGLPNQLFVLNNKNKQQINLVLENGKWESNAENSSLSVLVWVSIIVLLLCFMLFLKRFKPAFGSKKYLLLLFFSTAAFAQNNNQNIRGIVTDKLSQTPIIGATVQINNSEKQTVTDEKGNYTLTDITPDRYEIEVSFVGYKEVVIPNVIVTSGKEVILDITMEDEYNKLDEVVVKSSNKAGTINKLATVSARTFSMEEVNRYAGGRSDVARLVANFAGVSTPDDSRNDIVVRGNSPVGVLWRIDGMNVTNPNHFASVGTTGGAVSALNTNLLKNSDFFTSAFPAEYGNATSGVFDIGFRNGNSKKRETTIQLGVITGLEATTEGPINKEKGSSYLVGYRYSLAGVAQAVGVDIGTTATPSYQDLSFKLNSGTSRLGKFSMFGILATSTINISGGNSSTLYGNGNEVDFASKIGIVGFNHFKQINPKSFISSTIGLNYAKTDQTSYDFERPTNVSFIKEVSNVAKTGYNFSTIYNLKLNSKLFIKAGIQDEMMGLDLFYKTKQNSTDAWKQVWDTNSYTNLAQAFIHTKYSISEKLTLNAGVHSQKFFLNNSFSVEPRLGLKYAVNRKSSFSLGYGLHSQMQPINVYFLQTQNTDGSYAYNNKNLDFTKSQHFVLGYDLQPFKDWRLKTEVYYQAISNVPVNTFSGSYSMLNTGSTFKTDLEDNLTNAGTGTNYGAEVTIEKFFSNGYYGLFTSSLYSSKYKGSDGVERNTAFNGKYVFNILGGKEWKIGSEKRNKISTDLKFTNAGGRAYTPIDLSASEDAGHEVLSTDAYSANYDNYFRLDLKGSYTINSKTKKLSQSFSLDLQNVTNHKNMFSQTYDTKSMSLNTTYQLGFFPNFIYKLQF